MLIRIAVVVFLSVLEPVASLRDGEALAPSLAADPHAKESENTSQQETQEMKEASTVEVDEAVSIRKHNLTQRCDEELETLKEVLSKFCVKHLVDCTTNACERSAADTLQHASQYIWGPSMVTGRLGTKVPMFWAGFAEFDKSGLASKTNLSDFVKNMNGLVLHGGGSVDQTEWGEAIQEANDLKSCKSWERKKPFWTAASKAMGKAMYQAQKDRIVIAVHKNLTGDRSLFESILYQLELTGIGSKMYQHPEWSPTFEVYEIPVPKTRWWRRLFSSECTVAPWLKRQLEFSAKRKVAMTCALCPKGLRACGSRKQVTATEATCKCTAGDCRNGKGTTVTADGDRYEGDFKKGKPDGKGKYFFANGDRYEGDFIKGQKDGQGKYLSASGKRYEGDYKEGQKDGKGKMFYASGNRYEGDYKNGKENGKGTFFFASGNRYEGDWKNGKQDGKGKYFFANGECEDCVFEMGNAVRCRKGSRKSCGK